MYGCFIFLNIVIHVCVCVFYLFISVGTKNRTYPHIGRFIYPNINSLISGHQRCKGRKRGCEGQTNYHACLKLALSMDLLLNECRLRVSVKSCSFVWGLPLAGISERVWERPNPQYCVRSGAACRGNRTLPRVSKMVTRSQAVFWRRFQTWGALFMSQCGLNPTFGHRMRGQTIYMISYH